MEGDLGNLAVSQSCKYSRPQPTLSSIHPSRLTLMSELSSSLIAACKSERGTGKETLNSWLVCNQSKCCIRLWREQNNRAQNMKIILWFRLAVCFPLRGRWGMEALASRFSSSATLHSDTLEGLLDSFCTNLHLCGCYFSMLSQS